jgi:Methylamine utilisation protein MauE
VLVSTLDALGQVLKSLWALAQSPVAAVGAGTLVGAVFLVSGIFKLRRSYLVAYQLADLGLPVRVGRTTVRIAGCLEVAVGAGAFGSVATGRGAPAVAAFAAALLVVFTGYVIALIRRGDDRPCYCFSLSDRPVSYRTLVRNLVIFGLVWVFSNGTGVVAHEGTFNGAAVGAAVGSIALLLSAAGAAKRDGDTLLANVLPPTKTAWPEHVLQREEFHRNREAS